jgi:DNA-binding protein HU-beta
VSINKTDLQRELAHKLGLTRTDADMGVELVLETIKQALRSGDEVKIMNFGVFEVRERAARMGRNPRTNEPVPIPATRSVMFRAADALLNPAKEDTPSSLTDEDKALLLETRRIVLGESNGA